MVKLIHYVNTCRLTRFRWYSLTVLSSHLLSNCMPQVCSWDFQCTFQFLFSVLAMMLLSVVKNATEYVLSLPLS